MITLEAAQTLAGVASAATQVTCSLFGMELGAGSTETYKLLNQQQLPAAVATIYTAPASTVGLIKSIHVVNNDSVPRTFQLFVSGTAAADAITPAINLLAGGWATYGDAGWKVYDGNGALQTQVANGQLRVATLAADVSNSTTTLAVIAGVNVTLEPGTYQYQYFVRYQSSIITTGVKFAVDHTGTVTSHMTQARYVDASATASTGAPTQNGPATATAQVMGAYSSRADNTTLGPTLSTDAANAEMLMIIEGHIIVTVSGQLQLFHASETAAATTVKAGTNLVVVKTG